MTSKFKYGLLVLHNVGWFLKKFYTGTTTRTYLTLIFEIGKASSFEEEDGTGTGKNEVRIKLGRGDLGSQFTCQAENEAIEEPLSKSVRVDVNRKSKVCMSKCGK